MPAKAAIADRPSTIKAKYSDEWKLKATFDRKGANPNKSIAPNVPPINELIAAIVSALPAFPALARGYPSKLVATVPATPGAFISIQEVAPPKIAP